jgi:ligand-binding sensor protein
MSPEDWGLRDLVNLEDWKKIQEHFSEALDIALNTISPDGKLAAFTTRTSRLCTNILPKTPFYSRVCGNCLLDGEAHKRLSAIRENQSLRCPFGLEVFVSPIRVGSRIIAYVIIGPVILKARKEDSEYAQDARNAGVALSDLKDALIEINVFSYSRMNSITQLVEDTFSYIAQTGYHKKRLGEIAPKLLELDPLFSRYYEEKILNSLLNTCALVLDADSGSVMTLDRKTNTLHIKVASRLDDGVVNQANVKVGEGIAGVAAATAQPIILPKDGSRKDLAGRMNRKYIKSSMIVPFSKDKNQGVYGVINLNMIRKETDFSDRDIAIVKELVNMASVALVPLQQ